MHYLHGLRTTDPCNLLFRYNMDPSWSETGDRYLIKLFRDYLFHQVTETGEPWLDMSHIVSSLNKVRKLHKLNNKVAIY
jgi:hypothetical protein